MNKFIVKNSHQIQRLVYLVIVFLLLGGCKKEQTVEKEETHKLVLFDFEDNTQIDFVKPQDATFELVENGTNNYVKVNNGFTIRETGVKLVSPKNTPWDL